MADVESGPIIRTPRVPRGADYSNYEDAVMTIDCAPFWRKFGLHRWPCVPRHVWFVKDVCGVICAFITWGLITYATFVVIFIILLPEPGQVHGIINGTLFVILAALAVASHAKAMITDPVRNWWWSPISFTVFTIQCWFSLLLDGCLSLEIQGCQTGFVMPRSTADRPRVGRIAWYQKWTLCYVYVQFFLKSKGPFCNLGKVRLQQQASIFCIDIFLIFEQKCSVHILSRRDCS